jgi:hypothetical protein
MLCARPEASHSFLHRQISTRCEAVSCWARRVGCRVQGLEGDVLVGLLCKREGEMGKSGEKGGDEGERGNERV